MDEISTITGQVGLQKYDADDVNALLKSSFLPRLQVCGSSTDVVKEAKVTMGAYGLVYDKTRCVDLSKEIDILVLAFRPKALRIPKDGTNPLSYFNRLSPEFKRVQDESKIKDSGCMFGLEFLVYVPKTEEFATFYLGSFSARKEAPSLLLQMKKNPDGTERDGYGPAKVTCKTTLTKNKKGQSWHIPQFFSCSSDLSSLPETGDVVEEVKKFNNPPESVVEKAPEGESQAR